MKVNSADSKDKTELQKSSRQVIDKECLTPCDANFKDLIQKKPDSPSITNGLIGETSILTDIDSLKSSFNYDTFSIDKDDAKFFIDMVNNGQFSLNVQGDMNASLMQLDGAQNISTYKSVNVSKSLLNLIDNALTTQKPVRIDFDNNVAVILKVDKQGKVSAEFIPGDKAVEQYLKDNIGFLKQKFEEQNLPYNELSYRQHKNQNQKQKKDNDNNKGE